MNTTPYVIRWTKSFDDPGQFHEEFRGDGIYTPLGRGTFRAEATKMDVGAVRLFRCVEILPRLSSLDIPMNKIGLLTWFRDHPLPVVRGAQIQPGDLMCLSPGWQTQHRTFGPNECVA